MIEKTDNTNIVVIQQAVNAIKTAILQSQFRALTAVNQEQLALYYGIGRYVSANTRNKNWGTGVIEGISNQLCHELPGLRGFGVRQLKNMRSFYEAWKMIETNSAIANAETDSNSAIAIAELQLVDYPNFPILEFLSISFTHHIRILEATKDMDEFAYN